MSKNLEVGSKSYEINDLVVKITTTKGLFLFVPAATDKHKTLGDYLDDMGNMPPHRFLGMIDTITEEQVKEVVENAAIDQSQYKCYHDYRNRHPTAMQSFYSLLSANNINGRCAILKVILSTS